ncbi:Hypothetical protein PHPALM_2558, partial [Phytophthora palmivora]
MIQTVRVYVEDPLHADWDDIAEKMVYAAAILCKTITSSIQETKVSSGILRYYVSGNVCPPNQLAKGNVCAQFLLDGVFYAVKGKDVPPHYYHVQPKRMTPHCLALSKLPFGGHKKKSTEERKGNTKKTNQSGGKHDRPSEDQSTPQQHVDVADNQNSLDLSFDLNIEYEGSAPPSPEQFPSETFTLQRDSRVNEALHLQHHHQKYGTKKTWNHLAEIYPEVECRETKPDDENDIGFQILVTNITPTEEVNKSGEYAFTTNVKKANDATTIRDLIPAMSTDISEAVGAFELECQTLKDVKKGKEPKTLLTTTNSDDILKEITKNRLGFSIRMSKLMRQKSNLIGEFAQIHMWYR